MAVPFSIPDEEVAIDQFIEHVTHLLRVGYAMQECRRASSQITPRVRTSPAQCFRCNREQQAPQQQGRQARQQAQPPNAPPPQPEINQVPPEASANPHHAAAAAAANNNNAEVAGMLPGAGGCCDDESVKTRVRLTANLEITGVQQSVHQVDKTYQRQSSSAEELGAYPESLFSKLVPRSVTAPLCTAVLCVVGWQLLKAR